MEWGFKRNGLCLKYYHTIHTIFMVHSLYAVDSMQMFNSRMTIYGKISSIQKSTLQWILYPKDYQQPFLTFFLAYKW